MQLTHEALCVLEKTFCFGFILTVDTVNHRRDLTIRMFAIAKLGLESEHPQHSILKHVKHVAP